MNYTDFNLLFWRNCHENVFFMQNIISYIFLLISGRNMTWTVLREFCPNPSGYLNGAQFTI